MEQDEVGYNLIIFRHFLEDRGQICPCICLEFIGFTSPRGPISEEGLLLFLKLRTGLKKPVIETVRGTFAQDSVQRFRNRLERTFIRRCSNDLHVRNGVEGCVQGLGWWYQDFLSRVNIGSTPRSSQGRWGLLTLMGNNYG